MLGGDPSTKVELREQDCLFRFDVGTCTGTLGLQSEHARLSGDDTAGCQGRGLHVRRRSVFHTFVEARRCLLCQRPESESSRVPTGERPAQQMFATSNFPSRPARGSFFVDITDWRPTHCIYNLPATGIELLDVFRDYEGAAPIVHCYCFGKSRNDADAMSDVHARCQNVSGRHSQRQEALPSPAARDAAEIAEQGLVRWVRNVAQ